MKHTTDQSLIEACLAGRREAFGQLVERYQHRLFHSLVHLLGSTEDAQDAAQDALILAFEKLGTFRGESQFYSWLFRIAYNSAVSSKRKPGSSKRKTGPMSVSLEARRDASGLEPADLNPSTEPSFGLDVSDRQRLVQQALGELSEEFRDEKLQKLPTLRYYPSAVRFAGPPDFKPNAYLAQPLELPNPFADRLIQPRLNPQVAEVIYPSGAVFVKGRWLVSYGINDEHCALMKVDSFELERHLRPARGATRAWIGSVLRRNLSGWFPG